METCNKSQGPSEIKILILDAIPEKAAKILCRLGLLITKINCREEDLLGEMADVTVLMVSNFKVTRKLMEAGKSLRIIGNFNSNCDNIDLEAASEKKIFVVSSKDFGDRESISYAEMNMALILAFAKKIPAACSSTMKGDWTPDLFPGEQLCGKTLGIIGVEKVGMLVAKRAASFGMRVLFHNPVVDDFQATFLKHSFVSIEDLLKNSDYIVLHLQSNKCIMTKENIARMKPTAKLVNCCNANLVDENALCEALNSGSIGGAALDIVEDTRDSRYRIDLLNAKNIILTPRLSLSNSDLKLDAAVDVANCVKQGLNELYPAKFVKNPELVDHEIEKISEKSKEFGKILTQYIQGKQPEEITAYVGGKFANELVGALIITAAMQGVLGSKNCTDINIKNVQTIANENNIKLMVKVEPENQKNEFAIEVKSGDMIGSMRGTLNKSENVILTSFNDIPIKTKMSPVNSVTRTNSSSLGSCFKDNQIRDPIHYLVSTHLDTPGQLGRIISVLDDFGALVNHYQVSRNAPCGMDNPEATAIFTVDKRLPFDILNNMSDVKNWSYFSL